MTDAPRLEPSEAAMTFSDHAPSDHAEYQSLLRQAEMLADDNDRLFAKVKRLHALLAQMNSLLAETAPPAAAPPRGTA